MAAPVPAPSFVITRTEEWPDADFDLPDDQESFAIDNEEVDTGDISNRLKGSRPSLSGAGAVAKLGGAPVEDEDWDAEFEDPPPKSSTSSTPSMSASLARFAGKVTRLGSVKPETTRPVEDWSDDGDLELPEPSRTNLTLARAPLPQDDDTELEDTGDVSTIKVAKLNFPTVTALSKSALGSKSSVAPNEDDDFEADFALPEEMGNLSLKILTPQTSTLSLRHKSPTGVSEGNGLWGEMTTSSSAYSDTSSLMSMYPADASPSITASSVPGTETDPSDADFGVYEEDEDEAFDGLVLPEGLAGKALAKHLEIRKKDVPAKIAAAQIAKGPTTQSQKAPNEVEDFETGLLIGDDEDLSPSRLRTRREAIGTPRSKSVPVSRSAAIIKPSSRLRTESVMEVLASASNPPSITRSRSPNSVSRGSLSRKDSRSSLVSPTFSSLRPSSFRTTSSTLPPSSSSALGLLTIPGSPSVPSTIAPRPTPLKHQKSVGRLQLSSPATATMGGQRLPRKASLSSLADASIAIASISSSGVPSTSSTVSGRSGGFHAPTAASKARTKPEGRDEAERKRAYPVPPTRPTTPSTNPVALRLTMPTSSSRQKIRPAISSVFPSPATATSQSFAERATSTSPLPNNPRRTPTSPHRIRTRSGNSTGATPSSSISSITSAATAVKVLRKPKRGKSYGDGTELDAFEDLPEDREKERHYRVQPVGRGGVARGEKASATATAPAVASGGTIGRKAGSATGNLRRPPSSASSHGSTDHPRNPGMQSLRHKPRIDFPPKVVIPEPAARRRKPAVTPINGPRKKPMLIRNLGGAGTAKTVGDMKWNPKTQRWEGNEQVLKEFDSHLPSSRPALITHMTGSTLGGVSSPTGSFLASGARIVGNMMFDPLRMCWISRLPPEEEEPDVFAGLVDEGDEWEDKAGTIRANTGPGTTNDDVQDWKGSVRSMNSDRAMTMSPTRSYTKSMSESGSEAGDPPPRGGYDSRRSVRSSFGGQSVYEEVPGVDESLVAACKAAEERHGREMKGWYVRSRARSRSVKSPTDVDEGLERTHLHDIRTLATRKY